MRSILLLMFIVGCAALSGCQGSNAPPRFDVFGTAQYDGQLISDGDIVFLPEDGKGRPDGGKIVDGKFRFSVTAGKKRAEIRASRENPNKLVDSMTEPGKKVPAREDYIPARYNTNSELTLEVVSGENAIDFELVASVPPKS